MSEVKVGEWVRVVIEGEVEFIDHNGEISLMPPHWVREGAEGIVSIEVIPPPFVLPTKRWAQVLDANGALWTRIYLNSSADWYEWHSLSGIKILSEELRESPGLRVISEGVDDE